MSIVAIINPISGAGADPQRPRDASRRCRAEAKRRGLRADIHLTERAGHARELAAASAVADVDLVIVWGGDGTINEAGAALIGSSTTLGARAGGIGQWSGGCAWTPA